jgi:hypothetical protein
LMFSEGDMLAHAQQRAKEREAIHTGRKPASLSPAGEQTSSPSPVLIDSGNGRSGIGLGSRAGLPLAR